MDEGSTDEQWRKGGVPHAACEVCEFSLSYLSLSMTSLDSSMPE
jgi:hypothetical protein